jgi:hypothetical protein
VPYAGTSWWDGYDKQIVTDIIALLIEALNARCARTLLLSTMSAEGCSLLDGPARVRG